MIATKPECLHKFADCEACKKCEISPLCEYYTTGEQPTMKRNEFLAIAILTGWYTRDELITLVQNAYSLQASAAKKRYDGARELLNKRGYEVSRFNKPAGGHGQIVAKKVA